MSNPKIDLEWLRLIRASIACKVSDLDTPRRKFVEFGLLPEVVNITIAIDSLERVLGDLESTMHKAKDGDQ